MLASLTKQTLLSFYLFFLGLTFSHSAEFALQSINSEFPFTLYVINASHSVTQLDLKIYIDGELKQMDSVGNEADPLLSIPPHKIYTFDLPAGHHTLEIRSKAGKFSHQYPFEITAPLWGLFGFEYWNNDRVEMPPSYVEFYLQQNPIRLQ